MKLHLPKSLLVAVLAACVGGKLQAAEAFTAVDFTGDFYPYSYTFSFILNDVGNNGNVVGAYWGASGASDGYGANALTITRNDDGSYTVNLGRGQLGNTNIDATTTFTPKTDAYDSMTFEGTLKAGVVYTIVGSDNRNSGDYHASATITDSHGTTIAPKEGDSTYKNNMNGSGAKNTGVNSKYAVDAGDAILWHGTTSESMATDSDNWKTVTNEGISGITNSSALYFEAVDALSKNVDVTGLGEVGRIHVADNYSFTTSSPTTINATDGITIYSGKTLTLNSMSTEPNKLTSDISGGILSISTGSWTAENAVISSAVEVADDSTLTIGDGSILKASDFVIINGMTNVVTSGTGYVQLTLDRNELSLDNSLTATKEYRVHDNFDINGKGYNADCPAEGRSLTFNEGTGIIVDGIFSIVTRAVVNIAGGSVEASSIKLGHGTASGSDDSPYWGKIAMSSGSLKTGTITMQTDKQNVVSITGGELEFTAEAAINRGTNTASTVSIKGAGSSDTERVTLKATSVDWTLDGAGLTSKPVIGNVTIDAKNTYGITFANVALSGSIVNNADLTLDSGVSVATGDEVTISGNGSTYICKTLSNSGSLSLTGNIIMGGLASDFELKTAGASAHVLDANNTGATNTDGNGFVYTSGTEYWLTKGGKNEVANGIAIADASNNMFALQVSTATGETGIYFSTGEGYVDTSKFYVKSGNVSVVGTGAENATGADSYILQGGTMQLTGGTVKNSEIEYDSGGINLADTASVLELDDASTASVMLLLATGTTGTIDLKTTATILGGINPPENSALETPITEGIETTQFEGTLKVSTGGVLQLGSGNFNSGITYQWKPDVSSLAFIELAGGELKYRGGTANLGDIKVTAASTLHIYDVNKYDVGATDNSLVSIDSLNLGANLTLSTTWKSNVNIGLLTGTNSDAVMTVDDCSDNRRMLTAVVDNAFAGKIKVTGGDSTLSNLSFRDAADTSNIIELTGLKATGNGNADNSLTVSYDGANNLVKIDRQRSAENQATVVSDVKLASGSTLEFYGTSNQIVTTISKLSVTGTGTVKATNHEGNIVISGLTGTDASLNLETATPTSRNSLFTLNDDSANSFSGTINVLTSTDLGSRRTVFNLNSAEGAKNAVISLADGSTAENNSDTVALAIGANKVTIAGLKDGATHKDGTLMVVSGTQGIGTGGFASDGTNRTLEIATAGESYTSSAAIKENVNLVKSGEGTQTFTSSSIDSTSIAVNGGVLALTGLAELQLQDLVVKSGATLSVGNVVATVDEGSTNQTAPSTSVSKTATFEGGATIDGSLNLSNASSLTLNGIGENSLVMINGDLILPGASETPTLTLSGGILDSLAAMNLGEELGIFSVSGGFFVGNQVTNALDATNGGIALNTVFSASGDYNFEDYYLGFIPGTDEAGYSTVYIGKIVPEPTTATLSLLALAALAARRRRK